MSEAREPVQGVTCPVCGAQVLMASGNHYQDVPCGTCGTFITCSVAAPQPVTAASKVRAATRAEISRLRRKWGILIAVVVTPLLVLAPLSLRVGATGSAQSLRLCTMNLLLAALYGYGLMAGGYDPVVISRIVRIDMERRYIIVLFLPAFLVALFLGYCTYSP